MDVISNEAARNFLVSYQNLNDYGALEGHEGALNFMRKVRCIQYDPLNVVGRNPDLVLQSRVVNYRAGILEDLLDKERSLIDAMDKVLSIIPAEDYPKMTRVRKAVTDELVGILSNRGSLEALELLDEVRDFLRKNGPQPAGNIDIGGRAKEGRWGHKKLSSAALDYLYHSGQLGIRSKKKTLKIYDLSENLFPEELLNSKDPFPTEHEFLKWYLKRRIGSVGMARNKNTGLWVGQYLNQPKIREELFKELEEEGEILAFRVEGSQEIFYIRKEDTACLERSSAGGTAQFIAPLDNLIWDRGMTEEIFRFQYSWEVYTPATKRKYGYYVLPVLYQNRFIARFEPEKNNGKEPLGIKNWWWEPDVSVTVDMMDAVEDAFRRFSRYLGVPMMKKTYWKKKLKN